MFVGSFLFPFLFFSYFSLFACKRSSSTKKVALRPRACGDKDRSPATSIPKHLVRVSLGMHILVSAMPIVRHF
ncbi:hypothetical protein F4679DRAFT_563610 [Xylaria curta]|nr:hypothetical protein F4679DRAFT_563610 [Xylaria curta]